MSRADDIESYGRAVDAGDMTRTAAIHALVEASSGGLTQAGAADCIDNWQSSRAAYEREMQRAAKGLARIYGLD